MSATTFDLTPVPTGPTATEVSPPSLKEEVNRASTAFWVLTIIIISLFFALFQNNKVLALECDTDADCPSGQTCGYDPTIGSFVCYSAPPNEDVEIDLSEYLVLSDGQKVSEVFNTPASMVNLLVRVVFVGVGLILLVMIIVAGLAMIAGGTSDSKDKAKTTMTSALMGFLVIFAAYWIMQIIKIFTGADIGF